MKTLALPPPAESAPNILPARVWQDVFGLLLTLLALIVVGKLAVPRTLPAPTILEQAQCDPQHERCRLVLPGNLQLELHLAGAPVVPSQSFAVEVVADPRIRLHTQEIRGIELEMGSPSAAFSQEADGHYRSPANIPLCTTSRMTWRLAIRFELDGQTLEWPLLFTTETEPPQGLKT